MLCFTFLKNLTFSLHPHSPCSPPMLPVTRIRPCLFLFMSGRKVWMVRSVPSRLTSRIPRIVSSEWASRGPIRPTPALQTNTKISGGNQLNKYGYFINHVSAVNLKDACSCWLYTHLFPLKEHNILYSLTQYVNSALCNISFGIKYRLLVCHIHL